MILYFDQGVPYERECVAAHLECLRSHGRLVSTRDSGIPDTDGAPRATHLAMIRQLSMSERFVRALALSAYVRNLAWQGALRHSGSRGEAATVDRFLTQLYGAEVATAFRTSCHQRHE